MHTPHDHNTPDPQSEALLAVSLQRGHEQRDAGLKPIIIFVVVLAASIVVIQFLVWGLEEAMKHFDAAREPQKVSSVAMPEGRQVPPPEPRLQPSPAHQSTDHDDWLTLLARWNKQLDSYGKVDGDPTRARIPIDRAIEMAEKNGIQATKAAPVVTQPATGDFPILK